MASDPVLPLEPSRAHPVRAEPSALVTSRKLADVVHTLESFEPLGDEQVAVRDRMLAFVRSHPDALRRSCEPGHLTGSALVVDLETDRVLVLFHTKLRKWLQPGGHADGDANMAATALREAAEETGIADLCVVLPAVDLDIHEVHPPGEAPHLHHDIRFVVLAPPGATVVGNHESEALRWVSLDELAGLGADDGLCRLADQGLALARCLG